MKTKIIQNYIKFDNEEENQIFEGRSKTKGMISKDHKFHRLFIY